MKQNESVEKLEESKIHIKDAIKEKTAIHCKTEEEANRILGMAHTLGYKWWTGKNYENNTEWNIYKSKMCYCLFDGSYSGYDYFKNKNFTIIPSTQIADFEEKKSTDLAPAPEDIEAMKKYRLKQWYPSLAKSWKTDDRYEYDADRRVMTNIPNVKYRLVIPKEMVIKEQELHPDFWELIEEE